MVSEVAEHEMASYNIPAIEQFDFRDPKDWTQWIQQFEHFHMDLEYVIHKGGKQASEHSCAPHGSKSRYFSGIQLVRGRTKKLQPTVQ